MVLSPKYVFFCPGLRVTFADQYLQQKDRTEEIRSIVESYAGSPFEFVPLRLEDAFDLAWWVRVGKGSLSESARSLGLDMTDEGWCKDC